MQISKLSLMVCALALVATLPLRAEDTPAQSAARAALASKLFEISDEPMATNTMPAAPVVKVPAGPDYSAKVKAAQGGDGKTPVVISADKAVKYEQVVKAMDLLQRAGIQRVGLAVRQGG